MKQESSAVHSFGEQVCVIDKIYIPVNAISAYSEKSAYILDILHKQAGLIKFEIFQQKDESGNLSIITIATWKNQQHLDNAKSVVQEEMKKAGLNMPDFLKQQGIQMDRGIYHRSME